MSLAARGMRFPKAPRRRAAGPAGWLLSGTTVARVPSGAPWAVSGATVLRTPRPGPMTARLIPRATYDAAMAGGIALSLSPGSDLAALLPGGTYRLQANGQVSAAVTAGSRATPHRLAVYGDSFAQRSQDILGSPSASHPFAANQSAVDPSNVPSRWATDETSRVGGVQWGFASWLDAISGGRFMAPWQINNGLGGFNLGQLKRQAADGGAGPYTLDLFCARLEGWLAGPAALRPSAILVQAGTNDWPSSGHVSPAATSYADMRTILTRLAGYGLPLVVSTVLPKGSASQTRFTPAQIAAVKDYNDRLVGRNGHPGLAAEAGVLGLVQVVDPVASVLDPAAVAGAASEYDAAPGLTYDGLHLSAAGARILAEAYRAALLTRLPATMAGHLPGAGGPACFNANPLMTGTGGTVARLGNSATNAGFTASGSAPDGWTLAPSLEHGASAWNGTSPNNVTGTVTASMGGSGDDRYLQADVDCSGAGLTTANTRVLELSQPFTLPDEATLPPGDHYRAVAAVEIARLGGSAIQGFRGADLELRLLEPEAVAAATATPSVTLTGSEADGQTVTLGGYTYRFRSSLTDPALAGDVLIGGTASATATNLANCINAATTGAGTAWGSGSGQNPRLVASAAAAVVTLAARTRVSRSNGPAPNGTAFMEWSDIEHAGASRLILHAPPRLRKAGPYGACVLSLGLLVGGQAAIKFTARISRIGVFRAVGP